MSSEPFRTFVTSELDAVNNYKLLSGLITPRPIGWVGSRAADGTNNLAPFSFFNAVCNDPPTVMFSVMHKPGLKDTARNVPDGSDFTVNIVTEETATAMNETSGEYSPDVDEFAIAGLTAIVGDHVDAPRVAEATASLECRATQHVDLGREGSPPSYAVIFGEVLAFHVAERALDGTRIRPDELRSIGRLAGSGYSRTADSYFEMRRPQV